VSDEELRAAPLRDPRPPIPKVRRARGAVVRNRGLLPPADARRAAFVRDDVRAVSTPAGPDRLRTVCGCTEDGHGWAGAPDARPSVLVGRLHGLAGPPKISSSERRDGGPRCQILGLPGGGRAVPGRLCSVASGAPRRR
jgi:hypothetical protein